MPKPTPAQREQSRAIREKAIIYGEYLDWYRLEERRRDLIAEHGWPDGRPNSLIKGIADAE